MRTGRLSRAKSIFAIAVLLGSAMLLVGITRGTTSSSPVELTNVTGISNPIGDVTYIVSTAVTTPPVCAGKLIDLSTGTSGNTYGNSFGTVESAARWSEYTYPVPPTAGPPYAVTPYLSGNNPGWAKYPYARVPGPSGRIDWISPKDPTEGIGYGGFGLYKFSSPTWSAGGGGWLEILGFTGDDNISLSLVEGTATLWTTEWTENAASELGLAYPALAYWWQPEQSIYMPYSIPGTSLTMRLVANLYNHDNKSQETTDPTGFAVYAVYCQYTSFKPASYYPVKFVCNNESANPEDSESIGLEPGFYQTDINIHNSYYSTNVTVMKVFVMALNESTFVPAMPTPYAVRWTVLGPNAVMRLDCGEILQVLSESSDTEITTAKGYVILYTSYAPSKNPLDVWVEYTSEGIYPSLTSPSYDVVPEVTPYAYH
jgi:hypothetical protein